MILLTGATGTVGSALLRRLVSTGQPVRCLVREPKRLGAERVRVQIALGDLADPASFRNALRGVDTVVHLAASTRDQQRGSVEELNAMATLRLVRAAERSSAKRFLFFSAVGASLHSPARFFRTKALAQQAVEAADLATTVFSPSIIYAPGDPWIRLLQRFSYLPAIPVAGSGETRFQPIWADDVADCVMGVLNGGGEGDHRRRYELAGPDTLSHEAIVRLAVRAAGRRRPFARLPMPVVDRLLRGMELAVGTSAFATPDEAELLQVPMTSSRGTVDAERLGVQPRPMDAVLAV